MGIPPVTNWEDTMSPEMRCKTLVFFISCGAYVPLAIGGSQHPEEINLATYTAWAGLTAMLSYAAWVQQYPGWSLQFGFFFGNTIMVLLGLSIGGYTFNLGPAESVVLYGLILTVAVATFRWHQGHKEDTPRIVYLGAILSDILSFWPAIKQYLGPHDPVSTLTLTGFCMFFVGVVTSLILVDRPRRMYRMDPIAFKQETGKEKTLYNVFAPSFFAIENAILLPVTIYHMAQ